MTGDRSGASVMRERHVPFDDDGVKYCGWATGDRVVDGCGEVWPCSTVRPRCTSVYPPSADAPHKGSGPLRCINCGHDSPHVQQYGDECFCGCVDYATAASAEPEAGR